MTTPQQKAAEVSARNRTQRAIERKKPPGKGILGIQCLECGEQLPPTIGAFLDPCPKCGSA